MGGSEFIGLGSTLMNLAGKKKDVIYRIRFGPLACSWARIVVNLTSYWACHWAELGLLSLVQNNAPNSVPEVMTSGAEF